VVFILEKRITFGGDKMKFRFLLLGIILISLIGLTACNNSIGSSGSSASWAYTKMITLNNVVYVGTSQKVNVVGKKIGSVKYSSTDETKAKSNYFSNYYKKGTNLYAIPKVNTNDAIAVEIGKNHYIKAVNEKSLNKK
jgi:hypothetical protein